MRNLVQSPEEDVELVAVGLGFLGHYYQLSHELQFEAHEEMLLLTADVAALLVATHCGQLSQHIIANARLLELAQFLVASDGEIDLIRGKVVLSLRIHDGALCFTKVVGRLLH